MKEFLKKEWWKIIIGIPIILQILGNIINSIYLTQYNILDVNPFKISNIATGLFFIVINLIIFFVFSFKTDVKFPENNKNFFWETFCRMVLLTNTLFLILLFNKITDFSLGDIVIKQYLQVIFLVPSVFLISFESVFKSSEDEITLKKWQKRIYVTIKISIIVSAFISFIFMSSRNAHFKNIRNYLLIVSSMFYLIQITRSDNARIFKDSKFKPRFNFSNNGEPRKLDLVFILFILLISFSFFIFFYSQYIYIYIPRNFGGAKQIEIKVETNDTEYEGLLIHQNEKYFYVSEDNVIHTLKVDDIDSFTVKSK